MFQGRVMKEETVLNALDEVKSELSELKEQMNIIKDEVYKIRLERADEIKRRKQGTIVFGCVGMAWIIAFMYLYLS